VDVVEMNDEGLYVPDDVPEEASAARYEMLPKKSKLTLSERIGKIYEWMKTSERKWSERKRNLHPLVTTDTDLLSREVSNKHNLVIEKKTEQ
jgi:hypothetical protein